MAISLEFIDFIVPINVIKAKYPSGWDKCLLDHQAAIGRRIWFDDHLFRDGAMNLMDIDHLIEHWESLGFIGPTMTKGQVVKWNDFCVGQNMFRNPALICDWISYDHKSQGAYLKGTPPGILVGRGRH